MCDFNTIFETNFYQNYHIMISFFYGKIKDFVNKNTLLTWSFIAFFFYFFIKKTMKYCDLNEFVEFISWSNYYTKMVFVLWINLKISKQKCPTHVTLFSYLWIFRRKKIMRVKKFEHIFFNTSHILITILYRPFTTKNIKWNLK